MNELEQAAGLPATPGYRYAIPLGNELFVAGQVPLDGTGALTSTSVGAQTTQCLENLATVLDVHGFSTDEIRHLTIHVVGTTGSLAEAWRVVESRFEGHVPPATLLGTAALGFEGQFVEIDARVVRS